MRPRLALILLTLTAGLPAFPQVARLLPAPEAEIPFLVDGNSPSVWLKERLVFFTSDAHPVVATGSDQLHLGNPQAVTIDRSDHVPMWIESAWLDADGTIYGWYHNEPQGVCPESLTAPRIGAVVSFDGGQSFTDLGLILTSGDAVNCSSKNGFFAGGHGDFSVILDREQQFFYFFFTNYGGAGSSQGIAMARLAFENRGSPAGAVFKYHDGGWTEPGLGGRLTPVFRAATDWQSSNTDSFWGAAIHWNTYLQQYVILMNRACCDTGWPQAGIHITYNPDLSRPGEWTTPELLLSDIPYGAGYYPQVSGFEPGGTDTEAGEIVRLWVHGGSKWYIDFTWPEYADPEPSPDLPDVPFDGWPL